MEDGGENEEMKEVEMEIQKKDEDVGEISQVETGICPTNVGSRRLGAIYTQAFIMTFVAEWGDRSQVATIALGAAKNGVGVILGAVGGHSLCSAGACIGGKLLATRISERTVAYSGALLFIIFAFTTFLSGPP